MFLGDELTAILEALEQHKSYVAGERATMDIGVRTLPRIPKDSTDRNRTSPFAFTGNKFEFRSPGAAMSIADANIVINTIVADVLSGFADQLEKAEDLRAAVEQIVVDTISHHKRIIFNGNNYAAAWREEAHARGLLELPSVPDALPYFVREENIALFARQGVYSAEEIHSRYEIMLENYCKLIGIEAHTMLDIVNKEILPSVLRYSGQVAKDALAKRGLLPDLPMPCEEGLVRQLTTLAGKIQERNSQLQAAVDALDAAADPLAQARHCRDAIFSAMQALRVQVDKAEELVAQDFWPFPGYGELLTTK